MSAGHFLVFTRRGLTDVVEGHWAWDVGGCTVPLARASTSSLLVSSTAGVVQAPTIKRIMRYTAVPHKICFRAIKYLQNSLQ
jgi:hypothetical protein